MAVASIAFAMATPGAVEANSPPVCAPADSVYVTLPDGSFRWELGDPNEELTFTCADPERAAMTVQQTQNPQRGTAAGSYDPRVFRDALLNYRGEAQGLDGAAWAISDGVNTVNYAIRTTNVPAVNDPPLCQPLPAPAVSRTRFPNGDRVVTTLARCRDDEGAAMRLEVRQAPTRGEASLSGQFLSYKASRDGPDAFSIVVSDGTQISNQLSFSLLNTDVSIRGASVAGRTNAGSIRVSRKGSFTLRGQLVSCVRSGPDCRVGAVVRGRARTGRRPSSPKKTVTLVRSGFYVKANRTGSVRLQLSKRARKLLARNKKVQVKATLTVTRRLAPTLTKVVGATLVAPKRR